MARKTAPYGTWDSPVSPDDFAAGSTSLESIRVDRKSGKIYLLEIRPDEDGRGAIVEYDPRSGSLVGRDVLPKPYSALSQVHEYGGGSFVVEQSGRLIFTDINTKLVYQLDTASGNITAIVDEDPEVYYGDFDCHDRWVLAIKENHHPPTIAEVENTLVAINSESKRICSLGLQGHPDFVTYPRFSMAGTKICWVQFSFPNMPWDFTELWVADFDNGQISNARPIAGHECKASITQPVWHTDGSLFFVDDRTGFWQLYRMKPDGGVYHITVQGLEMAEFATCDWWLGAQWYTPVGEDKLVAIYTKDGSCNTVEINFKTCTSRDLGCPIVEVGFDALKLVDETTVAVIGSSLAQLPSLLLVDINNASSPQQLKSSSELKLLEGYAAKPQSITFPCSTETGGGEAHALYYPPTNPNFKGPDNSLPPLIVAMHGGPTWLEKPGLYLRDLFLYTRGYALVQVNFRGSSGYGKEYANRLNEHWGVRDIADAVSCVEYLAQRGLVDKNRVALTGHSGGGYATMQGLAKHPDVWTCGVAESGISDLSALVEETHKFESQYLQHLLYTESTTKEEAARIIKDRSPITHAGNIKAPMLIMGGKADPICPPNQNTMLEAKIREAGTPVQLALYDGEGHIFSRGSTLKDMEVRREKWFRKYLVEGGG